MGSGWQQHAVALLALLLLAASAVAPASAAPNPKAAELEAAINADYKFSRTNWDSAVLNDTLSKCVVYVCAVLSGEGPVYRGSVHTSAR